MRRYTKIRRAPELIRKLRNAGFSYRKISEVCGCSHGSISAELREWEKEKREALAKELGGTRSMENAPSRSSIAAASPPGPILDPNDANYW